MRNSHLPLALGLWLAASAAMAHPGHEPAGFLAGIAHPLGGLDHLLAMLAVGLFAARQEGAARWALPAGFVTALLAGAALGAAGLVLPVVEAGVAASVLVLGLLIASLTRLPLAAGLPLVAAFALFHGFAHHAEMGEGSLAAYIAGLSLTSALLHGAGYLLARRLPFHPRGLVFQRSLGSAIAAAGALLLAV
jgi:urease accessory protein